MEYRFVISLLFAILVAVFAIQNADSVVIKFLFAEFSISQALVILISAIVGAAIVMFLAAISQVKSNMKIRNLSKTISKLEEENKLLFQKIEQNDIKPVSKDNYETEDNTSSNQQL